MSRCTLASSKAGRLLVCAAALLAACAPAPPEARDATSVPPSEPALSPVGDGPEADPPTAAASEAGALEDPSRVEAPSEPVQDPADAAEEGSASGGSRMIEFFEIGRGDRVADLGGVAGYSLGPMRRAVGPAGVVYVRRSTPPPTEPAAPSDDLGKIVWMNTPDEAPLTADATRLNAATLLYGYHAVIAAGRDRKKLNAAVYQALVPGGVYIIADHAAPPGSGLRAAREQSAIEDSIVRAEVQAAGFEFVEAADFVSSVAREDGTPSQYVLKFRKPN